MMKVAYVLIILFLFSFVSKSIGQGTETILFYNLENLFDTIDNPGTDDDDFLKNGDKRWSSYRYWAKIKNTWQVIAASGSWKPPMAIGVCEIENKKVLEDLIEHTPLSKYPYGIVHYDSPDARGIDAGLLYRKDLMDTLHTGYRRIYFDNTARKTRDLLFAVTCVDKDTFAFVVNHWPSRWGGKDLTAFKRIKVAREARLLVEEINQDYSDIALVMMGDFNDNPSDSSIKNYLIGQNPLCPEGSKKLVNLATQPDSGLVRGTHKYQRHWSLFDQFIVSDNLIDGKFAWQVPNAKMTIVNEKFLLEEDQKYYGVKPFRTYNGYHYQNGFSDHLPVKIEICR
ncbi:MAG: endonuclease [Bacteroidota bacterium]